MIKNALKFLLAAIILLILFYKGKLDLSLIGKSFDQHKAVWFMAVSLMIINTFLSTSRWRCILQTKSQKKLPFFKVLKIQWIGLFFGTVLPGAISGDVIKIFYAKNLNSNFTKTFLTSSILVDRVFGLLGFVCILGISSIFSYQEIVRDYQEVQTLIKFNFLLSCPILLFLIFLALPISLQKKLLSIVERIPKVGKFTAHILEEFWVIGKNRLIYLKIILLSMTAQFLNIYSFWQLASPFFGRYIPLKFAFTFIPLGLISIAIPITPAGIGVGHAVFEKLFYFFKVKGGASLFNLHFILSNSIAVLGVFPYVLDKNKDKIKINLHSKS